VRVPALHYRRRARRDWVRVDLSSRASALALSLTPPPNSPARALSLSMVKEYKRLRRVRIAQQR